MPFLLVFFFISRLMDLGCIERRLITHTKKNGEQSGASTVHSFMATLLKHQYIKTPKSVILYIKKTGGMVLLD